MIILLLFASQTRRKFEHFSTSKTVFTYLIYFTFLMCASDAVAGIYRGQFFFGTRAMIEISNLLFFVSLTVISYLWMVYIVIQLKITKISGKRLFLWAIPLLVFVAVALSNPFTNIFFSIDENNLYIRESGVYFHWIVSWGYLIAATILIIRRIARETNKQKRKDLIPFLYFIVAPAMASVIQMFFYGVSSSQVGITISIVFISLFELDMQIYTDALTGLTNRHGFHQYLDSFFQRHSSAELCLIMVDINNFKRINDTLGHMAGDSALIHVAAVMKTICEEAEKKYFVCRYGGDEFLIAGYDCQQAEIEKLKLQIYNRLEEQSCLAREFNHLSVSFGVASEKCSDFDDVNHLLRMADEAMYREKKMFKEKMAALSE